MGESASAGGYVDRDEGESGAGQSGRIDRVLVTLDQRDEEEVREGACDVMYGAVYDICDEGRCDEFWYISLFSFVEFQSVALILRDRVCSGRSLIIS